MRNEIYNLMKEFNMFMDNEATVLIPVDVYEIENGYEVLADIPGVKKEDINISFEDGVLTIEAKKEKKEGKYFIKERSASKLKRVINFGDIEDESLKAKYSDGVLTIQLMVKAPEVKEAKKIVVE